MPEHISGLVNHSGKYDLYPFHKIAGEHIYSGHESLAQWISSQKLVIIDGFVGVNLFDKITIRLNNKYYPGSSFTIIANNNKPDYIYIESAKINGKKINKPALSFKQIVKGGVLEYTLGKQPNLNWPSGK